jgi:hypothetical protein
MLEAKAAATVRVDLTEALSVVTTRPIVVVAAVDLTFEPRLKIFLVD